MKASLPMYDLPALRSAHARYWALIRDGLRDAGLDAPTTLTPDGIGAAFWTAPDLVFSQTCGMPYRTALHGKVQIVGTPDYGIEGCPPGFYTSVLVKRREDQRHQLPAFDGARVAVNDYGSQSGFAALATAAKEADIAFTRVMVTGAHAASARAVAVGDADIAAIDAVTWALLCAHEGANRRVDVFARTPPTPGLPYICGLDVDRDKVFDAVLRATAVLPHDDRAALMLKGLVAIPPQAYLAIPTPAMRQETLVRA
jgi:ABC-type phosphate/phosphonate transport system substrate-binding protein